MREPEKKFCPLFCIAKDYNVKCVGESCAFFLKDTNPTAEDNVLTGEPFPTRPSQTSVGECAIVRIARGVKDE